MLVWSSSHKHLGAPESWRNAEGSIQLKLYVFHRYLGYSFVFFKFHSIVIGSAAMGAYFYCSQNSLLHLLTC